MPVVEMAGFASPASSNPVVEMAEADESNGRPHNPTDYIPADWTCPKESVQQTK
jgi:hypothetical protein